MAELRMKLKPWAVPNFATIELPPEPKQNGFRELPSIAVAELSADALSDLAEQWLTELYQKAGKPHNWTFQPTSEDPTNDRK
jgi:hypothetical protein